MKKLIIASIVSGLFAASAQAAPSLIAVGSLTNTTDLSGLTGTLENGIDHGNTLGGIGSGLAWAGGNTFLALPDRGPNATVWNAGVDNTTSYIARMQTVTLGLTASPSGSLPYTLTPTLTGTTLFYSNTALNYGAVTPAANTAGKFYFDGRSDNFSVGGSTNANNARLDPEGIRMSNDGKSVFVSDEYGPYVYQFDRTTGQRINSFALPTAFTANNLSPNGAIEISGNTSGRVANKGMEGLAISPDGKTLFGFEQSPLIQDGGDGGRANRIVSIDVATGATKQFVYDNKIGTKTYNSSEVLAINSNELLVLERDGKGKGDGSSAVIKQIYKVNLSGATDISLLNGGLGISGEANLLPYAVNKSLFLDLKTSLNAAGITDTNIPAKLEGMAFGEDIIEGATTFHTLYVANDNDFVPGVAGSNNFYVFKFTDADLGVTAGFQNQQIAAVPEPESYAMMLLGLGLIGFVARRKK
ncbi:MAG: esterase-like activity of phytase family protein [Methylophilaceae bacterium]